MFRVVNRTLFAVAFCSLSFVLLSACVSSYQPVVRATVVGKYPLSIVKTKPKPSQPSLKINGQSYVLSQQCIPQRRLGDDVDQRKFGDVADKRKFGDDGDQRKFGDDGDQRKFGDDGDQRKFGDDGDQRKFGGDGDQRKFGDDGDQRKFGDDGDQRKFGDDGDQRKFGDDGDQRKFGDDGDKREFGDIANQFKCVLVKAENATYVTGFTGNETLQTATGDVFLRVLRSGSRVIFYY